MRKIYYLLLSVLIILVFSSCNDNTIVGSWKSGGGDILYDQYNIITFNEDGTGVREIVIPENQDSEEIKIVNDIRYKIQDDTLYIDYISEDGSVNSTEQTFEIDNDTLTLNSKRVHNAVYIRLK